MVRNETGLSRISLRMNALRSESRDEKSSSLAVLLGLSKRSGTFSIFRDDDGAGDDRGIEEVVRLVCSDCSKGTG